MAVSGWEDGGERGGVFFERGGLLFCGGGGGGGGGGGLFVEDDGGSGRRSMVGWKESRRMGFAGVDVLESVCKSWLVGLFWT